MPYWGDVIKEQFVRDVANKYVQESGIPAFRVFPQINTARFSGYIAKYDKEDWYYIGTVTDYMRQGSVESRGDDYAVSSQAYTLIEYAFHKDVSSDDVAEYDNPYDPVRDAVQFVVNRLSRILTSELNSEYLTSGVWGTDKQGSSDFTQWSDSSSTPVSDVLGWKEDVLKTTGFSPNRAITTPDVYRTLKTNTDITGKMKTTDDKVVTMNLMARLFELDQITVLDTINSGATGFMSSKKFLLIYTPDNPSKFKPSAGYFLTYKGQDGTNIGTQRIDMPWLNNSLRIEAKIKADPVLLASDLGLYAYDVIA
jgi:hypothetical protein